MCIREYIFIKQSDFDLDTITDPASLILFLHRHVPVLFK